jgi:hypothetical protein
MMKNRGSCDKKRQAESHIAPVRELDEHLSPTVDSRSALISAWTGRLNITAVLRRIAVEVRAIFDFHG